MQPELKVQTEEVNGEITCSIEETNRIRASLGLKPLRVDNDKGTDDKEEKKRKKGRKETNGEGLGEEKEEVVGAAAYKKKQEETKKKEDEDKKKAQQEAVWEGKGIADEGDGGEYEDAREWVKKTKAKAKAKATASTTATATAQNTDSVPKSSNSSRYLKGEEHERGGEGKGKSLRISHNLDDLAGHVSFPSQGDEGGSSHGNTGTVLTLRDTGVLKERGLRRCGGGTSTQEGEGNEEGEGEDEDEDEEDTLENLHLAAAERDRVNQERKKNAKPKAKAKVPVYDAYEDDEFEEMMVNGGRKKTVLPQYDEEEYEELLQGKQKKYKTNSSSGSKTSGKGSSNFIVGPTGELLDATTKQPVKTNVGNGTSNTSSSEQTHYKFGTSQALTMATDFMDADEQKKAQAEEEEDERKGGGGRRREQMDDSSSKNKRKSKSKSKIKENDNDKNHKTTEQEDRSKVKRRKRERHQTSTISSLVDELEAEADAEAEAEAGTQIQAVKREHEPSEHQDDDSEGVTVAPLRPKKRQRQGQRNQNQNKNKSNRSVTTSEGGSGDNHYDDDGDDDLTNDFLEDDADLEAALARVRRKKNANSSHISGSQNHHNELTQSEDKMQGSDGTSNTTSTAGKLQHIYLNDDDDDDNGGSGNNAANEKLVFSSTTEFSQAIEAQLLARKQERERERAKKKQSVAIGASSSSSSSSNFGDEEVDDSKDNIGANEHTLDGTDQKYVGTKSSRKHWTTYYNADDDVNAAREGQADTFSAPTATERAGVPLVKSGLSGTVAYLKEKGYDKEEDKNDVVLVGRAKERRKEAASDLAAERAGKTKDRVHLEYRDSSGRVMTTMQAWRDLNYQFHGYGPGKRKRAKLLNEVREEEKQRSMSSGDTPLGTASAFRALQDRAKTAHVELDGLGKG